jgi:ADP-ribose pyrophosphatase YjhB (NUDIX family)
VLYLAKKGEAGMNDGGKRYCPYCGGGLGLMESEGRVRSFCEREGRFIYENPIPAATGVIVDRRGRLLLVLRNREPGKSEWSLPGGFVETGESPVEAAVRELQEETGLAVSNPSLIDVVYQNSEYYRTSLLIIGYHFERFEGELRPGDDAGDVRFFDRLRLPPMAFDSHRRIVDTFFRSAQIR